MRTIFTIALFSCCSFSFGQNIQTITDKVASKICDCISDSIEKYEEIESEFNRCYDKEFNNIFSLVDAEEQKILIIPGNLDKVKNGIIPTLDDNCDKIRTVIQRELESSIEPVAKENDDPCPTNFDGNDIQNLQNLDGEIIAFDALVKKVYKVHNGKPYYSVKLKGGDVIWIASLLDSGYEKKGNILRLLGYVSKVSDDDFAKKYNNTNYHILVFGLIDMSSKQMAVMPGSEMQIQEWLEGKIPRNSK